MRKITELAFDAFRKNKEFCKSNTMVTTENNETRMYLHGNCIARKFRDSGLVEVTTAGWPTPTTKERLKPFCGVHTVKGQLHMDGYPWTGEWTAVHNQESAV